MSKRDLNDSSSLFFFRIEQIQQRIHTLDKDIIKVRHYYSKAIMEQEREVLIDELITRTSILSEANTDQ